MFGLGMPEIVVIGIVGVAIFGSKRIPELGSSIGQAIRGFRSEMNKAPEPANPEPVNKSEPSSPHQDEV
ncbi:MAG: twin-arginine translocase TatA/TatE family subunit [Pseudanabaenaceae cyanobacterium bins.68]|nr:twin-arginine translocase TatA/TatE family subunit [Pseudanabaenaceae cyanobacterium bins.68]